MTSEDKNPQIDYKQSGVDVDAGHDLVQKIKPFVNKTKRPEILSGLGSFSALSRIPSNIKNPILVTCTDGVGTKIEIAKAMNSYKNIGIDLVAMCVNDLIVNGAEPLLFLDYYVTDKLDVDTASLVIEGIAQGCTIANCSLVGGETAEHPGSFLEDSFDLAGFSLGVVDEEELIGIEGPKNGDLLIGIASSGFHSNGYSLIRKVIKDYELSLKDRFNDITLGEMLLEPTNIYVQEILALKKIVQIQSMAHITGGGFFENIPRMLNKDQKANIKFKFEDWPANENYFWIKDLTNISEENMLKTFNCGIGLILAVSPEDEESALGALSHSPFFSKTIGSIEEKEGSEPNLIFV
ncbi:MAG: phosphoribosylformylglycinamidine cyclo-ligase [Gammaproteobacteria bacterium]|nr:phosphoribosylformylglycinamidine cyclo-ligase [Gammaproteobacteria bacterium]